MRRRLALRFWHERCRFDASSERADAHCHIASKAVDLFHRESAVGEVACGVSETDMTEDLKKIDVPTLILHGDDDQIVPIADSAQLSVKLVPGAVRKVYPGGAHGMCTTEKDKVDADLLAFCQASV
ncbi:hypothetical protein BH09PSE5_BH09PSE5_39350 [soil metagenome]